MIGMSKPPDKTAPSENDVLRRMLNTPPKPNKPKPEPQAPKKKTGQ